MARLRATTGTGRRPNHEQQHRCAGEAVGGNPETHQATRRGCALTTKVGADEEDSHVRGVLTDHVHRFVLAAGRRIPSETNPGEVCTPALHVYGADLSIVSEGDRRGALWSKKEPYARECIRLAALKGMSIKDFVLASTLGVHSADPALAELEALLDKRIERAGQEGPSSRTVEDIFEHARKKTERGPDV